MPLRWNVGRPIKHTYEITIFKENRDVNALMDVADLNDNGQICYGKFLSLTFNRNDRFSDYEIKQLIKRLNMDGDLQLLILNGDTLYNNNKYTTFSDGKTIFTIGSI